MIEKLVEKLNSLAPMNDALAERIRSVAYIKSYKAGEIILREDEVCSRICLIVKGLTRSYYINEGIDITSRFMEEGFIVTSWISYYTQKPGHEYIETTEETTLVCLDYADIEKCIMIFLIQILLAGGRLNLLFTFLNNEHNYCAGILQKKNINYSQRLILPYYNGFRRNILPLIWA